MGRANALDILLTGRWLKAAEAKRLKLINRVVPRAELYLEATRIAERIKGFNPLAVSCAKQAVVRGLDMTLKEGLGLEQRLGRLLA